MGKRQRDDDAEDVSSTEEIEPLSIRTENLKSEKKRRKEFHKTRLAAGEEAIELGEVPPPTQFPPSIEKTMQPDDTVLLGEKDQGQTLEVGEEGGVFFVLEKASLEAGKVGKNYQLLNCDDHANFLRKHKLDPAKYRPDIVHQALLAILDSPLNKAGKLKGLYVKTDKNVLIQVNPHIRIPRTFKRFCGLMVQLLQKLSIRATNGPDKLLKVVKQPVTRHLPLGSRRVGLSFSAPKVVQLRDYIAAAGDKSTVVFVVGAMAHGKIEADYIDDLVSVSEYPLSAACCIGRICNAWEQLYKIL